MGNKVLFLSDAHLGSGADTALRERDMAALLGSVKENLAAVVLLGDIFDFWFTYRHVAPRGFTRLIGKLAELADSGVEIHYFIGNHDMWVFDYFEKEIGAHMHAAPERLTFFGKTVLAGHGDGLNPNDRRYDMLKGIFRSPLNQRLFALANPRLSYPIAMRWSSHSRKKHSDSMGARAEEVQGSIYQFCQREWQGKPFDCAIFGHSHRRAALPLAGGATYYNIGNWIERRDYVVLSEEGVEQLSWHPSNECN